MIRKNDPFGNYSDDITMKRLQLLYLNYELHLEYKEIAKYVDYAISTIKTYAHKFYDLLETAKETFGFISQKVKQVICGGKQLVYLFKFYGEDNKLICSKVGTTTRLPEQRLKEEIRYYRNHNIDVENAEICSVIDCGNLPAEGAESYARAKFIKKYPKAFCKNDRFFNIDISSRSFNTLINNYLKEETITAQWKRFQKLEAFARVLVKLHNKPTEKR